MMTGHPRGYEPVRVPAWVNDLYPPLIDREQLRRSIEHHANLMLYYRYLAALDPKFWADMAKEARFAWSYALDLKGRE